MASRDGYRFEALGHQESGRSYSTEKDQPLGIRLDLDHCSDDRQQCDATH